MIVVPGGDQLLQGRVGCQRGCPAAVCLEFHRFIVRSIGVLLTKDSKLTPLVAEMEMEEFLHEGCPDPGSRMGVVV